MDKVEKLFIVPYCHADWAWTFTRRWHEKRYVLVFEEVLEIFKKHPDFRWYVDIYITELEPFLRIRPERYKELKKRIDEGKIGICGTFTNLRPSMVGEETQLRDILIGREKYKGLFPKADLSVYAGTVDVSLGHPQIPQILALSGYKYFRFWRPHTALSVKKVPLEFFWEGLDGSRILCSRGCYGGFTYSEKLFENFKKEISSDEKLSPTDIRWISQGTDDCRPLRTPYKDKMISIFDFIKKWNKKEKPTLRFATPLEFFKEIEKYKRRIPIIKGPLDSCEVCYNVGWGGSEGLFSLRQQNEINLTETEKWLSIASKLGFRYDEEKLETLWENHLLSCAHATQWLFEKDFEEIYKLALYVKIECERIKKEVLCFLKNIISTQENSEVILFNSLPFKREEKICLNISFPESHQEFSLIDGKNKNIPFQIMDKNENAGKVWEYQTIASVKLPPFGYNTISIRKRASEGKIKKIPFKVRFEGSDLTEIKIYGEKYITSTQNSFGNLKLYKVDTAKGDLHVGPIVAEERVKWNKTEIKEDGVIYSRYQSTGNIGNHEIKRQIVVYKDEPKIEFQIDVHWMKEDGFLTLEWPVLFKGKIYGDVPFGVEEKSIENQIYDGSIERQRKNLFFAKSFVNYTDGKRSTSYLNYDATHYYTLSDKSIGNILLNSVTHRPGWERFTNKKIIGEGEHRFVSHLIFHSGDWRRINLPGKSQSLFRKPEKILVDKVSKEKLPCSHSFFSISPSNLIMTGFYKEGRNFILRFYESHGEKTKARIEFPFVVKQAKKIDLDGKTLISLAAGKTVNLEVNGWEIVTLRFL